METIGEIAEEVRNQAEDEEWRSRFEKKKRRRVKNEKKPKR